MKVEHLKVVGFEEAMRGMRNAHDSWDKADSRIIPNLIPGTPEFEKKLEAFPIKSLNDSMYVVELKKVDNLPEDFVSEIVKYNAWTQEYYIPEERIDFTKYKCDGRTIKTDNVAFVGKNDIDLMQRLVSHDHGPNNGGQPNAKFLRDITVTLDITASFDFWKEFDTYKVGTVANSCSTMHTITKHPITIENISTADLRPQDIEAIEKIWLPILNERLNDGTLTDIEKTRILSKMNIVGFEQKRTIKLNYEVVRNMNVWRGGHKLKEWRELINVYFKNLPYVKSLFENNPYINK